uniref:SSD domain-containing protein n=1 Tax=Palpitomonas bilix TaxID=652834 RepID=A0A7S3GBA6_9EUKA
MDASMARLVCSTFLILAVCAAVCSAKLYPEGYCNNYGVCAREGGTSYNCPNITKSVVPSASLANKLAEFCPGVYDEVCCDEEQFGVLKSSVELASPFISGCPACFDNFKAFFCQLACSNKQASFSEITGVKLRGGNVSTDSMNFYVEPFAGEKMFNSCVNVKFSAANVPAMTFIGGGAQTYQQWYSFLGTQKPAGNSPYALSFPCGNSSFDCPSTAFKPDIMENCYDPAYQCACIDCPAVCEPIPPPPPSIPDDVPGTTWGVLPFSIVVGYSGVGLIATVAAVLVVVRRRRQGSHFQRATSMRTESPSGKGSGAEKSPLMKTAETEKEVSVGTVPREEEQAALFNVMAGVEGLSEKLLRKGLFHLGKHVAKRPLVTILVGIVVVGALSAGMVFFTVMNDPLNLWVAKGSTGAKQMDYFNENFGAFYRINQVIVYGEPGFIDYTVMNNLFELQKMVNDTVACFVNEVFNDTIDTAAGCAAAGGVSFGLYDLCYKPLDGICAVESPTQYWQNDYATFLNMGEGSFDQHLANCAENPGQVPCLSQYKADITPNLVLGGYNGSDYSNAAAIAVTWLIDDKPGTTDDPVDPNLHAEAWETMWLKVMAKAEGVMTKNMGNTSVDVAYMAQESIEQELSGESTANTPTIVISYAVMFVYIIFSLGNLRPVGDLPLNIKVYLALGGIFVVLASVFAAMGVFSYCGVRSTLIIVEVIPFLVLAVGVDNIFILVHTLQRNMYTSEGMKKSTAPYILVAQTLAEAGPSITLSAGAEAIAFGIGTLAPMPAVKVFSQFASLAVAFDYLLQITCFAALLALDTQRRQADRYELFVCAKRKVDKSKPQKPKEAFTHHIMREYFAPAVLHPIVKPIALFCFGLLLAFSAAAAPSIQLGLDQTVALPQGSYVNKYFAAETKYLKVGPPFYLVVKGRPFDTPSLQDDVCTLSGCNNRSLLNAVSYASREPEVSYVATIASDWLDDYLKWLSPSTTCCRLYPNGTFCPADVTDPKCTACLTARDLDHGRPTSESFNDHLYDFLNAEPSENCGLGGLGAYNSSTPSVVIDGFDHIVTNYRSYHTILVSQSDFINAYQEALDLADEVMKANPALEGMVFPYSFFYVYFEQYLNIIDYTIFNVGLCVASVFVVSLLVLCNIGAALIVAFVSLYIVFNMIGLMVWWNIDLNGVSLCNLVMAVGISVEFCVHIVRAFMISHGTRHERALKALTDMGSSVVTGITLTKFFGVVVLAFAPSLIFVIFYFRMYLGMVIFGSTSGLILLPIILSYVGPTNRFTLKGKKHVENQSINSDKA